MAVCSKDIRELFLKDKLTKSGKKELKILQEVISKEMPEQGETIGERKIQANLIKVLSDLKKSCGVSQND